MKYFTIDELSRSAVAREKGIDNTIRDEKIVRNLTALVNNILDPTRERMGKPIIVSSGYRCERLNAVVGGVKTSQHVKGQAADLVGRTAQDTRRIFELIRDNCTFDQLLFERNGKGSIWVHVSFRADSKNRHQCIDNYIVTK